MEGLSESTMWIDEASRAQLQHSITRLKQLDELPELPTENQPNLQIDPTRHLSTNREREISSNLAFLSAISDDNMKVMAVCVEEHPSGRELTIRISSNSGDLSEVERGFINISRLLEQAAKRTHSKAEDIENVFQQVIVLDLPRILTRLRSRHAKPLRIVAGGKPRIGKPIMNQLHEVINDPTATAGPTLEESRRRAQYLKALFVELESLANNRMASSEVQGIVGQIVTQVHTFLSAIDLETGLQNLPIEQSLKKHLPLALGKLARYYSATCELVCAARSRKCRLFENVHVELVDIQKPESVRNPSRKVHAEIQLLFFYELHPDRPRPRYISSSKSACYMCNLFLHIHGEFHTPSTHGRIYSKWTLPYWLSVPVERHKNLRRIITRLKATIDSKAEEALGSRKKQYRHPNESVLMPPAILSPSILSFLPTQSSASTIRRPRALFQKEPLTIESTPLPLTPPLTLSKRNSVAETKLGTHVVTAEEKGTEYSPGGIPDALICITRTDLPYRQTITSTTPSMHLEVDKLSLTLDFIHVFSGHILIEESTEPTQKLQIMNVEEIPTTAELQLGCSQDSNELSLQLRATRKHVINFSFVWDDNIHPILDQ